MSEEENKTQIDKLLEVMTDYGITSYIGLNFAEIRKEIIEVRKELSKKDKVIGKIKNKLEEHIKFCEQEAKGHLENNVCHISLKFEKELLDLVEKVGD